MGRRGPAPKPTALKRALGNPGKRALNEHEPVPPSPPSGEVAPPTRLSERAKEIWADLSPLITAMGCLTTVDVGAFGRYCEGLVIYLRLQAFVEANGTTYVLKDEQGKPRRVVKFPEAEELRHWTKTLCQFEDRFGLNPSARSRIRLARRTRCRWRSRWRAA